MNHRFIFTAAALASAMVMGCSGADTTEQTTESTDSTESASTSLDCTNGPDLSGDCDNTAPMAYTLTSVDGSLLVGVNGFGQTVSSTFASTTKFRLANLNRFTPGEPMFQYVKAYNTAVQNNTGVVTAVDTLYNGGFALHARVSVKTGATSVFAFRPVP